MRVVRRHVAVVLAYVALALALTWPLPLHLDTHLTGRPSGDTGVYVWNLWVFGHEVSQGRLPFFTSAILNASPTLGPVNLSLHNYTTFSNLLALPLVPRLGIVTTFNVIFLFNIALTGYAMYLLARDLIDRDPEAWLAGALFTASPVLIARGTAHFSLVAAAPLPIFVLLLSRTLRHQRMRDAVLTGLTMAWASFCDAYYAVYCLMIGGFMLSAYMLRVRRPSGDVTPPVRLVRVLDLLVLIVGSFVIGMAVRGGGPLTVFGLRVSMRTMYTPVLVLSCLVLLRVLVALWPRLQIQFTQPPITLLRAAGVALIAMLLPLSPVLYAFGDRFAFGGGAQTPIYWRSSPPGVDLLAFVLPNPNHAWWGPAFQDLIVHWSGRPDGFPEFAASIPFVALALFALAWWRTGWRPVPNPVIFTVAFALLSLGPFVHIAGMNTHVPGPWALLRYVPAVGLARSPSRFAIVAMMGVAVLFAVALAHVTTRRPHYRRRILLAMSVLMLVELFPGPRALYSAEVPSIYRLIANDASDSVRVLELPFGVRDGASSLGNFNAATQYYQTAHGKGIIGGYVSRVTTRRKQRYRRIPMLDALLTLSEGRRLTDLQTLSAEQTSDRFLTRSRVGYVVVDRSHTSPELLAFARRTLGLSRIAEDQGRELYMARPPRSVPEPFGGRPAFLDSLPRP